MKIAIYVVFGILALLLIYFIYWEFRYRANIKEISQIFKKSNCIVYGRKGCGKDLIFNAVINERNELCYSNILYNQKLTTLRSIKDFSVEPNTFENMLEQDITIVDKNIRENTDMYISDGGIYLPSQYSQLLCKKYPSLPIFYALSRHLGNMNIHINTQYLGRVWDKLREQADGYFKAVKTTKTIFGNLITEIIYYDTYKSAMAELQPYEKAIFESNEEKASLKEFTAKNGVIKRFYIKQKPSNIHYDTRYFHKKFFGKRAPNSVK